MGYGEEIKDQFLLNKSVTFVNHGAYGLTVKPVMDHRIRLIYEQENQPDEFFRFNQMKYYDEALTSASEFLGANKENLVLVDNVTTGINTIIKSLKFKPDDQILIHSHTYNAMRNTAIEQCDENDGISLIDVSLPSVLKSEEDIVNVFKRAMDENPRIKLAIIDHITSSSAIIFPIEKLIALCKEKGVLSVIDGAHAAGQLKLNLEEYGADFYSGNFHKWCYSSRPCGYLWISPPYRKKIRPLVTSHGYKMSLSDQFCHLGTRDISHLASLPTALKFYKDIGGRESITSYADELLTYAQEIIAESLCTEKFDIPHSMRAPCMALVKMPSQRSTLGRITREIGDELTKKLYVKHNVQASFTCFDACLWLRCSANVYNTRADYVKVKDAIVEFMASEQHLNVA